MKGLRQLVCLLILTIVSCQAQQDQDDVTEVTDKPCPAECDLRQCAQVIADECDGQIIKDECNCCPVCEPTPEYEPFYEQEGAGEDTVLMFVNATHKEACSKIQCNRLQICSLNIQGIPRCRCPTQFFCRNHKMSRKDVCAQDGETYKSRCFLRMKECNENRRIGIKHRGPCFKGDKLARKRQKQQRKKDRGVGKGFRKDGRRKDDGEDRRSRYDEGVRNKGNKKRTDKKNPGKKRNRNDRKGGRAERKQEKQERKVARREEKMKERREDKLGKRREQRLKEEREKKRNKRRKMRRKERRAERGKRSCPDASENN